MKCTKTWRINGLAWAVTLSVLALFIQPVHAQTDTTPPSLTGAPTLSPELADVSDGAVTVTITLQATDAGTGVQVITGQFVDEESAIVGFFQPTLSSGTQQEGEWSGTYQVQRNTPEGVFELQLTLFDFSGNNAFVETGVFLTVTGSDTAAPVLVGTPTLDPAVLDLELGDQTIVVEGVFTDDDSGVESAFYTLHNENGESIAFGRGELVDGTNQNGTWRAEILLGIGLIELLAPSGNLTLQVQTNDAANNLAQLETGAVLEILRERAVVTFQVDVERLEALGLFRPWFAYEEQQMRLYVDIFDGPEAGVYELNTFVGDVWSTIVSLTYNQDVSYAFVIDPDGDGVDTGDWIYELEGSEGGRALSIGTDPIEVPLVTFDNFGSDPVAVDYQARITRSFVAGAADAVSFDAPAMETLVEIGFADLDRPMLISVLRYGTDPGGALPAGIVTRAENQYWEIAAIPSAATFSAELALKIESVAGIAEPEAVRLLRREGDNEAWSSVTSSVNPEGLLLADNLNAFSTWTLGSTSPANTFQPQPPGVPANPVPADGDVRVDVNALLSWDPAPYALYYDVYIWPSFSSEPDIPQGQNLDVPQFDLQTIALDRNTTYNWRVVARNLDGEADGPSWSFTTEILPDLTVSEVQAPAIGFSGQPVEISWVVTNEGEIATDYPSWKDAIEISPDPFFLGEVTVLGSASNPAALPAGGSYAQNASVTLPDGLEGTYYIRVIANRFGFQEELTQDNNAAQTTLEITLTPPPDLEISQFTTPFNAFSGDLIQVSWTVTNTGPGTASAASGWSDALYLSSSETFDPELAEFLTSQASNRVLDPGESYTDTVSVKLPTGISGTLFLHLLTDPGDVLFENGEEENNVAASEPLTITLSPPPDVVVTEVSVPPTVEAGATIQVLWTVENQGPGSVDGLNWQDEIYLSTSAELDVDEAMALARVGRFGSLDPDSLYMAEAAVRIPDGLEGAYYLFVQTDGNLKIFEHTFEDNNAEGIAVQITRPPYPDLSISGFEAPATARAGSRIDVGWSVRNEGETFAVPEWADRLYLSDRAAWDTTAVPLLALSVQDLLDVDASYTRSYQVTLPADIAGMHYFHLVADDARSVFEYPDDTGNNVLTTPVEIEPYPPVDLAVTAFSAPEAGNSSQPVAVSWTIENQGEAAPLTNHWVDILYLSVNQRIDVDADIEIARIPRTQGLAPGASYSRSGEFLLPDGIQGAFHLLLQTDAEGQVDDVDPESNSILDAGLIDVTLSPSADLVPIAFDVPATGTNGQPITVSWSVENQGAAEAAGAWKDAIYISRDKSINVQDIQLSRAANVSALPAGARYETSLDITLPIHLSGVNYLLLATNQGQSVFEGQGENNNVLVQEIDIQTAPPGNLVVSDVVVPDMGVPGEELVVSWEIQNTGLNTVKGFMFDAVYLSADTVWQVSDPLLGVELRNVDLAPGASFSIDKKVDLAEIFLADAAGNITGEFPGLPPGEYHAIVRTDIRNNFQETNESDNATASTGTIATDIQALALESSVETALPAGASRYYRVEVPDGIETFRLSVETDAANAGNELYVSKDVVPSLSAAEYRSRDPFVGNPSLLVPAQEPGEYYVLLFARQGPEPPQQVTLTAEPVSFELQAIDLSRGGAGGKVTVRMQGAAFKTRLRVALEQGEQRYTSLDIHWVSQVEAYATLDLTDVPAGSYDFVLEQNESLLQTSPDEELPFQPNDIVLRSVLPGAFEVAPAPVTLPEISVIAPDALRATQAFTTQIEVTNNGLNDLVSPLLLVGIDGPAIRTSLHVGEDVTEGIKRVLVLGDGPLPGILRPGAQHRVTLFATAPDTSTVLDVHVVQPAQEGVPFDFDRELRAASLDEDVFGDEEAIDQLHVDFARGGWEGYEAQLAATATRMARMGIREPDGSRLLQELVQETLNDIQTPPFEFIPASAPVAAGKNAAASLPLIDITKTGPEPDCSFTTLTYQIGTLETAAAFFASPFCEGPTGAKHLVYFLTGQTPTGGKVVYENDSEIAAKIREHDSAHRSYDEVSGDAITEAAEYIKEKALEAGCEGPPITRLPDIDYDDTGKQPVKKPSLYLKDMESGIPYDDPRDDEEEELGFGKHVPGCELVTSFGAFQSAKARLSNMAIRRIKEPKTDACEVPGCKIIFQGTISFEFGDNYGFNENDTGEYDIMAKNVRDCGIAKEFDTQVNMHEEFRRVFEIPPQKKKCKRPPPPDLDLPPGPSGLPIAQIPVLRSQDPNDILGPAGYGDEKWVSVSARLPYTIRFENDPELATAPAQLVTIEQKLDSTLDTRSLRLGPFGFGDFVFEPPANTAAYTERLDLTDSLDLFVDINAGIDIEQNRAFWILRSIDPETGGAPSNPLSGFLPVNDSLGAGEGFVSYVIRPNPAAQTGDRVDAQARIIFDANEAIDTPPIFNTIDAGLPSSTIVGLPARHDTTAFAVSWSAEDDPVGSGLRTNTLYVSRDGGPFEVYQKDIEGTQVIFNAAKDHEYSFFTIASDQAGNMEPLKSEADAVVRVDVEQGGDLPDAFSLAQNYPNPFNLTTTVPFALPQPAEVELIVYNVLGQRILHYQMGDQAAGRYNQLLDMSAFASGVYFYEVRVRTKETMLFRDVKKMVYVR